MSFSSLSSLDAVRLRRFIPQERRTVWEQVSNASKRRDWWPDAAITLILGGEVQAQRWGDAGTVVFVGEVDVLVDGHALGFRWSEAGLSTYTSVLMTLSASARGTEFDVVEVGFDGFDNNADRITRAEREWSEVLAQLSERVSA